MALSTEQVLLLNNLMYMNSDPLQMPDDFAGKSVGYWLGQIDVSQLKDSEEYGSFMTGRDWKNIIQAVQNDDTLANMRIVDTQVDSAGGGGRSAIFTSDATGDAVVVFKGTESSAEWSDNFTGGNVTDTPYQENALEWYQSAYREQGLEGYDITVTGHSKGGNKAKYITLLDNTVDRCVSFDGQGFSDEFMDKYADQIASRQSVIENHNVDYDYVNLLLNDVGETTYYEGHDYGSGGFLENHCPNTFMDFGKDGNFTMNVNPNGQAAEMKALDEFLNNMLRSLPEEKQTEVLMMVNAVVDNAFSLEGKSGIEIANIFLQMAADPKYSNSLSYVVAYLIEYEQAHPEFADQITSVLKEFGMGDCAKYVDIVKEILNFSVDAPIIGWTIIDFDMIASIVASAAGDIPDWLLDFVSEQLEKRLGIKLTREELRNLLNVVVRINEDMGRIKIEDNGSDITIVSVSTEFTSNSGVGTHGRAYVEFHKMRASAEEILRVASLLSQAGAEVEDLANNLTFAQRLSATSELKEKLRQCKISIDLLMGRARDMGGALNDITGKYESTETLIVGFL